MRKFIISIAALLAITAGLLLAQQGNQVIPAGGGTGSPTNSASPVMAYYFTNACPVSNTGQCFFTPANTQIANDCTWTTSNGTVTCASSHFAATDVGKRVAGYFMNGVPATNFGCVAGRTSFVPLTTGSVTISSFISATSVTLSATPSNAAPSNEGCFIWGTPDDANASALETAYDAVTSFCPKVMLAAAGYWWSSPHFSSQPAGCAALPSLIGVSTALGNMVYTAGFDLEGRGPGNTVLYLGPDFPNGDPCTRSQGNITNACFLVPVEGQWRDFQISGGGQLACQVASNKVLIGVTVGTLHNISLTNMCESVPGAQIGIEADLLAQLYQVNDSNWGNTCLQTVATNASYVQAFKLACENSPGNNGVTGTVDIQADTGGRPTFTCWGCLLLGSITTTNMNVLQVAAGATVRLIGGDIANCEATSGCTTSATTLINNKGGTVYLDNVTETANGGASPIAGMNCVTNGGIAYVNKTTLTNASNHNYQDTVSGCTIVDLGGNGSLFTGTPTLLGTVQADGRTIMFSCTGTANASVTNSLYGTGPNVTATTCAGQTSTLGAGIPFQNSRTIAGVICTSSATTVSVACTVMVNGSASSTTCTMTAATRCSNFTTTAVNPGDLLSAKIVTGAAETGANIKMQVIWQ